MATKNFPYSAFLRGPSQVLPSLDDADVILERRDDENLVLMRAERFEAGAATLRIAARALAILARRNSDLAEEVLGEELPWTTWLPEDERHLCVRELLGHLVAGADTGELIPFSHALTAWRSTAIVWSDPNLARRLQGPFPGNGEEVDRPLSEPQ
ncbi:hypothetical protein [Sphaerisporangium siamense]|uniref:PHD/YefM family antitoxin component YafN of YafNO toxin-antitoxin module n=1 Tax=Sphaerisporangium siamense TaxID=795645 RepID=A0A7W7D4U9_9ACTN|nr:hypothetical protein [Sphaerisporangium siamense]MBB4698901.1 PHD/YefM family antitoxin component YafN of YafNO toxin-antitoxin module [Sphaerisporangium siamense]